MFCSVTSIYLKSTYMHLYIIVAKYKHSYTFNAKNIHTFFLSSTFHYVVAYKKNIEQKWYIFRDFVIIKLIKSLFKGILIFFPNERPKIAKNVIETYLQNPNSMASRDRIMINAWLMSARNTASWDTAASSWSKIF